MFYQSSVSLTHHWLHYINWILSVTNLVFPLKDTQNLNFNASKCCVYCSASGQRLYRSMFYSSASRQEFQSSQLCHSKFIVIPFKVHSYANRQKFQSLKSIALPICRSSKSLEFKVTNSSSSQMIQSSTFHTYSPITCLQFINCGTVLQFYPQVENLKLIYPTVLLISVQRFLPIT